MRPILILAGINAGLLVGAFQIQNWADAGKAFFTAWFVVTLLGLAVACTPEALGWLSNKLMKQRGQVNAAEAARKLWEE